MSPPTEQLIRDYLNRLSVAARGRLDVEDRRALVARTQDFIERNASLPRPATSMQVAALLARLGDPGVLVDQEVARLAAVRGDPAAGPAARPGRLQGRLRRRNLQASWHWPLAAGSPDLQSQVLGGSVAEPAVNGTAQAGTSPSPHAEAGSAPPAGAGSPPDHGKLQSPPAGAGSPDQAQPASFPSVWVPAQRGPADSGAGAMDAPPARRVPEGTDEPLRSDAGRPGSDLPPFRPSWPSAAALNAGVPGAAPGGSTETAAEGLDIMAARSDRDAQPRSQTGLAPLLAAARGLAATAGAGARRQPAVAAAVILLGVGGVTYPPVWILGALMTAASRAWDYRDKWIGLGGPILLLVIGTAAGVALGTSYAQIGGYVHEGWIYLNILSRAGAVGGTWYLVWRLTHARRMPAVPPWNKPHRVD